MLTRSEIERITGFSRRTIQRIQESGLVAKRNKDQGITYEYDENEVETFIITKFFKDCGLSHGEIKELLEEYREDRKLAIYSAKCRMKIKIKQLQDNLNLADNLLQSNTSIFDIVKITHLTPVFTYEDLIQLQCSFSQMDQAIENCDFVNQEGLDLLNDFELYLDSSKKMYKSKTLNQTEFKEKVYAFIDAFSKALGFYSIIILQALIFDKLDEKDPYDRFVFKNITSFINENEQLFVEFKDKILVSKIMEDKEKYSYDSERVQKHIEAIYKMDKVMEKFGIKPIDSMKYRLVVCELMIGKEIDEPIDYEFIVNAMKYFIFNHKE